MAKDNDDGSDNLSATPSSKRTLRSKPYDANNSFVKKVATKVTDLLPQKSWISKWFNNSQDEQDLQIRPLDNDDNEVYEDKQTQPPPMKRPCIRMDVTHPPGTFSIQPRNKNGPTETETSRNRFSNHNETTKDFSENTSTRRRLDRFVSSTPAFPMNSAKMIDPRSALNMLMSEQNNNSATNGVDDNSESSESTSGCSSLIPQNNRQEAPANSNYNSPFGNKRRYIDEKLSFTNHLQSPKSLFLENTNKETLSSRRPSFNPSLVNNITLGRSASLSSPFYQGNTMFGGANAANLYRSNSTLAEVSQIQSQAPQRATVEVKPTETSKSDISGMSHTARRILETLEQFSSPLSDAKKIPMRNFSTLSNQSSPSSTASRKRTREDEISSPKVGLRHLTRELHIPTVPDILRLRRQQRLQNSTVNARKIMSTIHATTMQSTQDYHIRSEPDPEPKRSNQLKAKKKTNLEEQDTVEAVNLPTIPLPISNLPRFDISLPQCTKPATQEKSPRPSLQFSQNLQQSPQLNKESFQFASPIKLTHGNKNLESINNFTFSKPISPSKMMTNSSMNESQELSKTLSIDSNSSFSSSTAPSFPNFIFDGPTQTTLKLKEKPKEKEKIEFSGGIKVASELKEGSVMDFFKKQSTKSVVPEDVWECNDCLIKNNSKETHCVACKSAKPSSDSSSDIEILEVPSDDDDVMVIEEPKKETKSTTRTSTASNSNIFSRKSTTFNSPQSSAKLTLFNSTTNTNKPQTELSTFSVNKPLSATSINLEKPQTPLTSTKTTKSSWECPCCMVRNADTATTCPCCNTAKPGSINVSPKRTLENKLSSTTTTSTGFGDKFKKPEGSWTCDTCMVPNKTDVNKCVACETPKSGAAAPSTSSLSGFGNQFKKPEGSWTCDTCMVPNKADTAKCVACETPKPGASKPLTTSANTPAASGSFSGFGDKFKKPEGSWTCDSCMLSNKSDTDKCVACEAAKPGTAKPASNLQFKVDMPANAGSFKFGIDKAESSALPKTNGFNFNSGSNQTSTLKTTTSGGFSFGLPKDTDATKTIAGGFNFKPSESVAAAATFQFGTKPLESPEKKKDDEQKETTTSNFAFGAPVKSDVTSTPVTTGFVFGASAVSSGTSNTDKKDEKKDGIVSTGFSFGAQSNVNVQTSKEATTESKPASETPPANNFLFGSPKPISSFASKEESKKLETPVSQTTKPTLSFGTTEQKSTATPTFSFGAATTSSTTSNASSSSLFTFTASSKPNETSTTALPAFGSQSAPKPTFSFGKPAESSAATENKVVMGLGSGGNSFGSQTSQGTPSLFGNLNTTPSGSSTSENKSLFGAPDNKIASTFGEPSAKRSAFGSTTENKSAFPSATPTPTFGAPTTAASPFGSTGSVFGSGSNTTPAFGSGTATPQSSTSSMFAPATKSNETPAATPGMFTFGSSQTPAASNIGYNFLTGTSATPSSTATDQNKSNLFTFGSSSTSGPVGNGFNSGTSAFGSAPAPTASATPTFTFNQPKPDVSSFGQPSTATTSMFNAPTAQPSGPPPAYPGTANTTPAATSGFNFGNTNMPSSFNFSNAPAPAPGGFTFNAPTNTAAPPAFDPNTQPTFNFTANSGPPTAFNAPPATARKIKKAVRRMPRQ